MQNCTPNRRTAQIGVPFLLTAIVLLSAAGARYSLKGVMGSEAKVPVPLRLPLSMLDKEAIGPYEYLGRATLGAAVLESLGTDEYINWGFRDTSVKRKNDPLRRVNLHITYYTGGRDLVPHTPDQCMKGAGYDPTIADNITLPVEALGTDIPVRALTFEKSSILRNEKPTVCYTFHVNGEFKCTRNGVRKKINVLGQKKAYFCKIEVSFGASGSKPRNPSREDSIEATARFLDHLLPVLLESHLPDWQAVTAEGVAEDEEVVADRSN